MLLGRHRRLGHRQQAGAARGYGFQIPYAAEIRRETGLATMAVGLIIGPHQAEAALQAGEADLVAIGREAMNNPNWALMAAARWNPAAPRRSMPAGRRSMAGGWRSARAVMDALGAAPE